MDDFCSRLANILELDKINSTDVLSDFEQWDSLSVLSVIAMIDAEYGVNLTAADLKDVETAQDLYELVSKKRKA